MLLLVILWDCIPAYGTMDMGGARVHLHWSRQWPWLHAESLALTYKVLAHVEHHAIWQHTLFQEVFWWRAVYCDYHWPHDVWHLFAEALCIFVEQGANLLKTCYILGKWIENSSPNCSGEQVWWSKVHKLLHARYELYKASLFCWLGVFKGRCLWHLEALADGWWTCSFPAWLLTRTDMPRWQRRQPALKSAWL